MLVSPNRTKKNCKGIIQFKLSETNNSKCFKSYSIQ